MKWSDTGSVFPSNSNPLTTGATGPFTGSIWKPTSGTFSQFNGLSPDKTWNFCTSDALIATTGTFYYWGLIIKSDACTPGTNCPVPLVPTNLVHSNAGANVQIDWNGLTTSNGNQVTFEVDVKDKSNNWVTLTSPTNQLIIPMSNF